METLVTIERALEIVRQTAVTLATEWVPLSQSHNRILSEDLTSKVDDPPFDNSAMDGWAVRALVDFLFGHRASGCWIGDNKLYKINNKSRACNKK